jgi:hypothetical protein
VDEPASVVLVRSRQPRLRSHCTATNPAPTTPTATRIQSRVSFEPPPPEDADDVLSATADALPATTGEPLVWGVAPAEGTAPVEPAPAWLTGAFPPLPAFLVVELAALWVVWAFMLAATALVVARTCSRETADPEPHDTELPPTTDHLSPFTRIFVAS